MAIGRGTLAFVSIFSRREATSDPGSAYEGFLEYPYFELILVFVSKNRDS